MLTVTNASGFGAGGTPDATILYQTYVTSSANSATYTFSSTAIGAAAANRTVIAAVTGYMDGGGDITAVTIGGVSATELVNLTPSAPYSGIWEADVPTGTTGDIVVSASGTPHRCSVGVWALYGVGASDATASDSTNPLSQSLVVSAGGVAIALSHDGTASSPTCTWGGDMNKRFEGFLEANTSASGADASSSGTKTVAATWTSFSASLLVAAAWPKG